MKKLFLSAIVALMGIMTMSASTVYCKMTQSWWTADGAAVGVYYWGTSSDPAWPGVRMSPVSGQDGMWSYDLPSGVSNVIFVRVNGDGAISDWGAKTKDLTLPTDGNNLYTITSTEPVWGNPGCDGAWSKYEGGTTPPTPGTGLEESGEDHIFALIGSIGGDWNVQEQLDEYKFDARGRWSGTLKTHPAKENISYVVIMDEEGNQYKTKGWQGENATKVTLYWANGFEDSNVWQLPAAQTIYLIMRKCTFKGSIEVEKVDQATYNAYTIDWGTTPTPGTAIQNVSATLDINAPMFDILGRKVNADYKGIVIQNGQKYIR